MTTINIQYPQVGKKEISKWKLSGLRDTWQEGKEFHLVKIVIAKKKQFIGKWQATHCDVGMGRWIVGESWGRERDRQSKKVESQTAVIGGRVYLVHYFAERKVRSSSKDVPRAIYLTSRLCHINLSIKKPVS